MGMTSRPPSASCSTYSAGRLRAPAVTTITSNGGGDTAAIDVAENTTTVTTVTADDIDGDTPTFGITGGADSALFERCIKPYDLALMNEMDRACAFNILHVCDYWSGYRDLSAFVDYPGHVLSMPHDVGTAEQSGAEALFDRPLMGGLDRHGVIASGPEPAIVDAVRSVLADAPPRFFLGADCTLPGDVSWDNIRTAVTAAHQAH